MKKMTPLKAIKANCVDCMCGQKKEVRLCPSQDCPLHPYRFGKNPNRSGIGGKITQNDYKQAENVN